MRGGGAGGGGGNVARAGQHVLFSVMVWACVGWVGEASSICPDRAAIKEKHGILLSRFD